MIACMEACLNIEGCVETIWANNTNTGPCYPKLNIGASVNYNNNRWGAILVWGAPKPYGPPVVVPEPTFSEEPALSMAVVTTVSAVPSACQTGQAPLLRLTAPTPLSGLSPPIDGRYDDDYGSFELPFDVEWYGQVQRIVHVGINGYITLIDPTTQFEVRGMPSSWLPKFAAAPFWDDLYIKENTDQGIWYQTTEDHLIIEWIAQRQDPTITDYVQFQLVYARARPGVLQYRYFITGNGNGNAASVGVQGDLTGTSEYATIAATFSYRQSRVLPCIQVTCDTNGNSSSLCTSAPFTEVAPS
ncbi:hypothetical protein H2199_002123 [Coniosporium tulheliwenetii]|uniref:Uncharacterized protein n=1 Tax=Coniosporium tulheliwenetii TaxID=3383036 RepID=A0ACC2ZHX2_9PEZI|nr:hypothetical protein H2199_002123 [Cladosporium sp. JES 115]